MEKRVDDAPDRIDPERTHLNLVLLTGNRIIRFEGVSIPPHVRVNRQRDMGDYLAWECEVRDGAVLFEYCQDWDSGDWIGARNWPAALKEFAGNLPRGHGLSEARIEEIIRELFPDDAARLDVEAAEFAAAAERGWETVASSAPEEPPDEIPDDAEPSLEASVDPDTLPRD